MKLEELLGSELYAQVQAAIDKANEGETDKLKRHRYADLSEGGYVAKDKYTDLEASLTGKQSELDKANSLIEELKKSNKGNEELQTKITGYETEIKDLQAENARLKAENALKFALIQAGATDLDYAFYKANEKLKEDGKVIELDESEHVKGVDDLIKSLKIQLPNQFDGSSAGNDSGRKEIEENNLPNGNNDKTVTREQFLKMGFSDRLKLKQENPELFHKFAN